MRLSEVYLGLGEQTLGDLLRVVSIGRLKSFQLYERLKVRFHLNKLNSETLRKSAPKFWQRLKDGDEEFASELAQAILVSHLDMIVAILNYLGVPHSEGFFEKDLNATQYLTGDWQQRAYNEFRGQFPEKAVLFYLNHLGWEMVQAPIFLPVETAV
ncbi:MAG: hypothetical protein NTZ56_07005 [Acidobacteria bacterium]|nr:hypothetical protein [Acidobacteriota bacterium]